MSGAETVSVTYVGKHTDGVYVPLPSGESVPVAHGESVEVPADVAARLLEQEDNWQAAATRKTRKAAPETPTAGATGPAPQGG